MKKSMMILSAMLVLLGSLMFTGCLGGLEPAPEEEWEYKAIEYEVKDSTILLDCYVSFSEEEYTVAKVTFPAGLNIMIVPDADSDSEILSELFGEITDKTYILKSFPLNEAVDYDEEEGGKKKSFKASKTKWNIMYYGLAWDEKDYSVDPFCRRYTQMESIKGSFSFKQILTKILLSKVLE